MRTAICIIALVLVVAAGLFAAVLMVGDYQQGTEQRVEASGQRMQDSWTRLVDASQAVSAGDLNLDGVIDERDLAIVRANYTESVGRWHGDSLFVDDGEGFKFSKVVPQQYFGFYGALAAEASDRFGQPCKHEKLEPEDMGELGTVMYNLIRMTVRDLIDHPGAEITVDINICKKCKCLYSTVEELP